MQNKISCILYENTLRIVFYNPFSSSMVCCMLYTYLNCPAMKCSLAKQAAHETYVVCSYTYEMREIEKKY